MEQFSRYPNCKCKTCNKDIYKRPSQINKGNVFCSKECYFKSCTILVKCLICNTEYKKGLHKKTCSKSCANKLRIGTVYKSGLESKSKELKYRKLKEQLVKLRGPSCEKCNYSNTSILNVHHKIRKCDGGTDDISNLQLICPNCHAELHYGDNKAFN